jgi:tripartite-type tricarboxylate transporter receptor subunit TctC
MAFTALTLSAIAAQPPAAPAWHWRRPGPVARKPIKLTVPYTPGGSTDIVSRTVFDAVSKSWASP